MPSPFPGMDPYIEHPEVWSDFHGDLAAEIRAELNKVIQPRYVARLTPRVTYEVVEIDETRSVRPDVGIWQRRPGRSGWVEGPPSSPLRRSRAWWRWKCPCACSPSRSARRARCNSWRQSRFSRRSTSSPATRPTASTFASGAKCCVPGRMLEIDLLRGGRRPPLERPVPPAPYYVLLSRVGRRPKVEVWPVQLREKLPTLPVPLLEPDPDAPLDLAAVVAAVYERGGYARLIDYSQPPPLPRLSDAEAAWLDEHFGRRKRR